MTSPRLTAALLAAALLGASLPWINGGSASLQPGLLDFAEWLSLLPAIRINTPLMLPALFLRLSFLALGLLIALNTPRVTAVWLKGVHLIALLGIALALLPPVAFFTGTFDDTNYQQQFAVWLAYLILAPALLIARRWLPMPALRVAVALVAVVLSLWGLIWGWRVFLGYALALRLGTGGVIFSAALLAIAGQALWARGK